MKPRIISLAIFLLFTSTAWAQDLNRLNIDVRPIIAYARFDNSRIIGNTETLPTRVKSEDVVGGLAASFSHSWKNWRGELEYGWRVRTDLNGYVYYDGYDIRIRSNIENHTIAANLFRYFEPTDTFQAYVMAGIGVAINRSQSDSVWSHTPTQVEEDERTEAHLMWSVGFGAVKEISDNWSIDLGYRLVGLGEATTPVFAERYAVTTGGLRSHDIALTLKRRFD